METACDWPGQNLFNSLEDGLLVHILSHLTPLPDLFNARAACRRFRRLSYDQRLYLHVIDARERPRSGLEDKCFPSLELAVASSRPGDTVRVHPGRHVTANVSLKWPLQITGASAAGSALFAPRGADAAIMAFSTLRLADLVVMAELGACVQHASGARLTLAPPARLLPLAGLVVRCARHDALTYRDATPFPDGTTGNVLIERCTLQCADHPLEHLVTPIVSVVAPKTAAAALESVLSVAETRLEGGAGAIRCVGNGIVQSTRTIYFSRATPFFWFRVVGDPTRSVATQIDAKGRGAERAAPAAAIVKAGPFLYGGAPVPAAECAGAPAGQASVAQPERRPRAQESAWAPAGPAASVSGGGIVRAVARTRLLAPGHKRGGHLHGGGSSAPAGEQQAPPPPRRVQQRRLHDDRVNGLLGEDDGEAAAWGWESDGEDGPSDAGAGGGGSVVVVAAERDEDAFLDDFLGSWAGREGVGASGAGGVAGGRSRKRARGGGGGSSSSRAAPPAAW